MRAGTQLGCNMRGSTHVRFCTEPHEVASHPRERRLHLTRELSPNALSPSRDSSQVEEVAFNRAIEDLLTLPGFFISRVEIGRGTSQP